MDTHLGNIRETILVMGKFGFSKRSHHKLVSKKLWEITEIIAVPSTISSILGMENVFVLLAPTKRYH